MTFDEMYTNQHDRALARPRTRSLRWTTARAATCIGAVTLAVLVGCKDSNVPDLTAPTSVSNTPTGVQNAITGLFGSSRNDVGTYAIFMSTISRDAANFVSTEPQWVTMGTGVIPITSNDGFWGASVWDLEYRTAKFANSIIASVPNVAPPYTTPQQQAIIGIAQTMKALMFMMLAETHDTGGVSIASITSTGTTPAPILCNKDVWAYIVALLDSSNTALNAAGKIALPVSLPPGFASVSAAAAPSTAPGAFAAFNRALAAKAGLELAYAIARATPGTAPTPTSAGSPNVAALTRADSAMKASALFSPANITLPAASGFSVADPFGVYHAFSPQSGDLVNPVNSNIGTMAVLNDLVADVDTAHDARWGAKFSSNPNLPVSEPTFSGSASPFIYSYYRIHILTDPDRPERRVDTRGGPDSTRPGRPRDGNHAHQRRPPAGRRLRDSPDHWGNVHGGARLAHERAADHERARGEWRQDDLDPYVRIGRRGGYHVGRHLGTQCCSQGHR